MTSVVRETPMRLTELRIALPLKVEARLTAQALELRAALKSALDAGHLPIRTDTGALAESLYVQTAAGSDYNERRAAAESVYHGSKYEASVRAKATANAYTPEHFEARVAPEEALPQVPGEVTTVVATMLAWGFLWEFGHYNRVTEQEEQRPWMTPLTQMFWHDQVGRQFGLWD